MKITIQGKIIEILPLIGGVSTNGTEWKKQVFIIKTFERYPQQVAITLFTKKIDEYKNLIAINNVVNISVDVSSRRYEKDGKVRYLTDVKAYKMALTGQFQTQPTATASQQDIDDIPF